MALGKERLCRVPNKIHSAKKLSKKLKKIPNGLEKLPKFHVKQSMLSIAYTKKF